MFPTADLRKNKFGLNSAFFKEDKFDGKQVSDSQRSLIISMWRFRHQSLFLSFNYKRKLQWKNPTIQHRPCHLIKQNKIKN